MKAIANVAALGGSVIGSFLVASNTGMQTLGYTFFLVSSAASLYLLWILKDRPVALILQNLFFIAVNIYGLLSYSK